MPPGLPVPNAGRVRTLLPCSALIGLLLQHACVAPPPLEQRVERDLLERQRAALHRELAREADAEHEAGAVVLVPASLIAQALEIALPLETVVADRFRIRADSAQVDFTGGLALVRLSGQAQWADRTGVSAAIDLIGALQILEIRESTGRLSARVEILGFETRDVRLGSLTPPAERLLNELAQRPVGDLNALLERIEVPVHLTETIRLPAVEEDEITIPAVDVPLAMGIHDVRVGADRLWIYLDIAPGTP